MRWLRWRGWISVVVLGVGGWLTHWLLLGFVLLPVCLDLFIHANRDRRYRYTPFWHTRRMFRLLFVPRRAPGPDGPLVIPEASRASAHWSPALRAQILARDGHCQCPGCPRCYGGRHPCAVTYDLQIDHLIPRSRGGATTARNGRAMCGPCNRYKGNRMPAFQS